MSENLAEVIFYHALEQDAITPQSMAQCLEDKRKPIRSGALSNFYEKDLKPLQQYGEVGEEDIPQRYRNFIDRIGHGIKESAGQPGGFSGVFYPLSGVDLSAVVPLLKDQGVLVTLDSDDPFKRGYRPDREKAADVDRAEIQRDAFEKATHGMHSIEMSRGGWGISADLQLAGFNPEKGDSYRILDQKEGPQIEEDVTTPTRKRTIVELQINGKTIHWTHYQMNLGEDTLTIDEPNQEGIWQDLRRDLRELFSNGEQTLVLSKAGMGGIGTKAVARCDLLQPGNYICVDICNNPTEKIPGLNLSQRSLDQLSDLTPQFDESYIDSHKMVHPYISFGYQDDPTRIFLAKVEGVSSRR